MDPLRWSGGHRRISFPLEGIFFYSDYYSIERMENVNTELQKIGIWLRSNKLKPR